MAELSVLELFRPLLGNLDLLYIPKPKYKVKSFYFNQHVTSEKSINNLNNCIRYPRGQIGINHVPTARHESTRIKLREKSRKPAGSVRLPGSAPGNRAGSIKNWEKMTARQWHLSAVFGTGRLLPTSGGETRCDQRIFLRPSRSFKMTDLDKWIDVVKECKYLPENDLKKLCEIVSALLLEESNIQPVSTPVTVCGDIHGQVTYLCFRLETISNSHT